MGNAAVGPFQVAARLGNGTLITNWAVSGLLKRFEPGHTKALSYDWQTVISGNRTVRLIVDEADQIVEPCANSNNTRQVQLVAPASTDLALSNPATVPALFPPIPPGTTATVILKVDLANLGSVGTSAGEITVKFWNGDPAAGGTLIGSQVLTRGNVALPATASVAWPNRGPGVYNVYITVDPVSEETNLQNNRQQFRFTLPVSVAFMPFAPRRSSGTVEEIPADAFGSRQEHERLVAALRLRHGITQKAPYSTWRNDLDDVFAWPVSTARRKARRFAEDASQSRLISGPPNEAPRTRGCKSPLRTVHEDKRQVA